MLMGSLPTIANAKDDAFVLYSEDGEHMRKMKREYFTADIERVGCDYWKEGSGADLKNAGGTTVPEPPIVGEVYDYSDPSLFDIYKSDYARNYKNGGNFWICLRLKDWTQEVNSDFIMCGGRVIANDDYLNDIANANFCALNGISRINGNWPAYFYNFEGNYWYSPYRHIGYITTTGSDIPPLLYGDDTTYTAIATADVNKWYGFHGQEQAGTIFPATFSYKHDLSEVLSYYETPPCGTSCFYSDWIRGTKEEWAEYYDVENEVDKEPFGTTGCSFSNLSNPSKYYKLIVGNTIIQPPTRAEDKFYHIIGLLPSSIDYITTAKGGVAGRINTKIRSFIRPKGVLFSIPAIGIESYSHPVYSNDNNRYRGGYMNYIYGSIAHQYWMSTDYWYEYRKSLTQWPMQSGTGSVAVYNSPSYLLNDLNNEWVHNNYFAISRKGIQIKTKGPVEYLDVRFSNPPTDNITIVQDGESHTYTIPDGESIEVDNLRVKGMERSLLIGHENFLKGYDVDGLRYGNGYYLHMEHKPTTFSGINGEFINAFDIVKYDQNVWNYDSVKLTNDFFFSRNGNYIAFQDQYAIDFTFDTNTIKVTHHEADLHHWYDYDEISLKTLHKMTLKNNGTTYHQLTTFDHKYDLNGNYSDDNKVLDFNGYNNYGFNADGEFVFDTTNKDIYLPGFRVDSNTARYAGAKAIRANSIIMKDNTGRYQSIRVTNSVTTTVRNQANTSAKFRPEDLYFCKWEIGSGSVIVDNMNKSPLYKSYKKVKIEDISGYDAPYTDNEGDLYLVGTIDSNGYFSVLNNNYNYSEERTGFLKSKLPTSNDGYYYIHLGKFTWIPLDGFYLDFNEFNPIYFYYGGRIQQYHYGNVNKYFNGVLASQNAFSQNAVDVKDENGVARIEFDNHFANTFDQSTGVTTLNLDMSTLPGIQVRSSIDVDDEAMLNIGPSTLTKVCDLTELKYDNNDARYYVDLTIIFSTTDGTAMTDGLFEARVSYSSDPSLNTWIDGRAPGGYWPCGYFKRSKSYIPGESEVVIKITGLMADSNARGAQYPYLVVRHSCSTNIDVGYVINQYRIQ